MEGDLLTRNFSGLLAKGDMLIYQNVGAYSLVMKPPFILPNFPILELLPDGSINVIRRAEKAADIFGTYAPFEKQNV